MNDLKKGDIILFKGETPISRLVRIFTKNDYTHSACYIGNNLVVESDIGGVQFNRLDIKFKNLEYIVLRHRTATSDTLEEAVEWMCQQNGKRYDYLGLIGIGYTILTGNEKNFLDNKDRFWCTELIADGYLNAGIPLWTTRETWRVKPSDFLNDNTFRKVYKR